MVAESDKKKIASLQSVYGAMPTLEIWRRLENPDISPTARMVAEMEIERRKTSVEASLKQQPVKQAQVLPQNPYVIGGQVILFALLVLGITYWVEPGFFLLALLAELLIIGAVIGKIFPNFGRIVGTIFMSGPIWSAWWMHYEGLLAWKGGDFRPLETLVCWAMLFVGSMLLMCFGGGLLNGSRDKKSWHFFTRSLAEERIEQHKKFPRKG